MEKSLSAILSSFAGGPDELIPILQKVQHEFGYLSDSAMAEISEYTGVPASRIYAVATFYAQFRFTPIGRNHVTACRGTACHVRGAPRILDVIETTLGITDGDTTEDMEYSLETVACIGACGLSPCIMINRKVIAKMTPKKVTELFSKSDKN
ncbi:NADH-quinone oxidoreductase subunit NuoE [Candidatus Latescibacterota bacterium]